MRYAGRRGNGSMYLVKIIAFYQISTRFYVQIGAILDCKSSDRKCRQEIKLMDRSTKEMYISLILWDSALQMFTMSWKPLATGKSSMFVR